jgi:hypothetical protein
MTRRALLGRAGAGAAGLAFGSPLLAAPATSDAARVSDAARTAAVIPLPSPAQVRADFQRMVDFGPRLTGNANHNAYIAWLERELLAAGARLEPCSSYELTRWSVGEFGLEILSGAGAGPVEIATYYPRSQETPAGGIEGPLIYGGAAPLPSFNANDLESVISGIESYPEELASWASALPGLLGDLTVKDSVMVVDLPLPAPLTTGIFLALATYLQWDGHTIVDWADDDYKRSWVLPGLGVPLAPFRDLGAAGVVFILDSSLAALEGAYIPFVHGFEPIPALYVDRDTGNELRSHANGSARARLTLTAARTTVRTPSIVAVIPGESKENIILNTHTDGEGFAEENGGVCLVHLARHFGSLPPGQRLQRTIVFSLFTGHMDPQLPETQGFINDNPQLIANAAAALTIEHFGCSEWIDDTASGYHATGQPETLGVWTTQGPMFEATKAALESSGVEHVALLRPPLQFGVGGAFQTAGVPQIGAIAGPVYLLTISENSDMDKLDEALAARQIAWIANLMWGLQDIPKAELRTGDPTLGRQTPSAPGTGGVNFMYATCAPPATAAAPHVIVHLGHPGDEPARLRVSLRSTGAALHGLTLQLRRGDQLVAQLGIAELDRRPRELTLRRPRGARFTPGRYELTITEHGRVIARHALALHRR